MASCGAERRLTLGGRRLELSQFSRGEVDGRKKALAAAVSEERLRRVAARGPGKGWLYSSRRGRSATGRGARCSMWGSQAISPTWRSACLGHFGLDGARQLAEQHAREIDLVPGVVDVDADDAALGVVVHNDSLGDLAAIDTWPLGKLDVERVGVGVVVEFHGRNPRSANALWIVIKSSSVTTRMYRSASPRIWAQNLQRYFTGLGVPGVFDHADALLGLRLLLLSRQSLLDLRRESQRLHGLVQRRLHWQGVHMRAVLRHAPPGDAARPADWCPTCPGSRPPYRHVES